MSNRLVFSALPSDRRRLIGAVNAFCRDYRGEFPKAEDAIELTNRKSYDLSRRESADMGPAVLSSRKDDVFCATLQGYLMGYMRGSE